MRKKGIIMFHSKSTEDTEKFAASIALKYGVPHTFCLSGGKIGVTLELNAEALAAAIGAKFADLTL